MREANPETTDTPPTDKPKRSKLRWVLRQTRRLIVLLGVGLLVFVVGFGLYAWEINYRGDRAVRKTASELSDRGLLDLYFSGNGDEEETVAVNSNAAAMWRAAMEAVPEPGDRPLLSVGVVATNAVEDRQQFHPDTIAAQREVFKAYPHFLSLVEAARNAPPGRFDIHGDLSEPMKGLELLGKTRRVARWLEERSFLAQADQDSKAFTESICSILELSEQLNQEADNMSAVISRSIDALAQDVLMSGLSRIELSSQQLERLTTAFKKSQASKSDLQCLGMDLSWQYHMVSVDVQSYLRLNEAKMTLMTRQWMIDEPDWFTGTELPSRMDRFWPNIMLTICPGRYELHHTALLRESLGYYDQLVALKDKPKARWAWLQKTYDRLQAQDDEEEDEFRNMEGNNVVISARSMTRMESAMSVTPVALLVEKYRSENSRWPEKLSDALNPVPSDAFGQVLRYRKDSEGVLIYSLGMNGNDEQGYGHYDEDVPPQYPDADDWAFRLYNPELRNAIPPPDEAVNPDYDELWVE